MGPGAAFWPLLLVSLCLGQSSIVPKLSFGFPRLTSDLIFFSAFASSGDRGLLGALTNPAPLACGGTMLWWVGILPVLCSLLAFSWSSLVDQLHSSCMTSGSCRELWWVYRSNMYPLQPFWTSLAPRITPAPSAELGWECGDLSVTCSWPLVSSQCPT